jgi:DNA-binding protein H-NS
MGAKLSVEEVLANLERRAASHREQEAFHAEQVVFHARQEEHHQEQQALHAAELQKVLQHLESFRSASITAVDLAQTLPPAARPVAAIDETPLPARNRKMVGRLLKLATESPGLPEPFGPTDVAAEANRRFAGRLPGGPVGPRTTSDVLRRMLAEGEIQLIREGKPFQEALYARKKRQGG